MTVEEAVNDIITLYAEREGATLSLYFGDLSGMRLYAVSVCRDRSLTLQGQLLPPGALRAFIREREELLSDPRNSVGVWFDVTTVVPDRDQAIAVGQRYNQVAIYDPDRQEAIEVGGTGEPPPNMPPARDRLPPWRGRATRSAESEPKQT